MFKVKNQINDSFFDDINGHSLDKYQRKAIVCDNDEVLVIAGAGSGKTLTIIGKIKYLIEKENYKENEILCLSFTNETVNNLRNKLNYSVKVLTFHKLALSILKENKIDYHISSDNLLTYIVNEFFELIEYRFFYKKLLLEYFNKDNYKDISNQELKVLKLSIMSFIKMIKCNNLSIKRLNYLSKKCINNKEKIFLILAFNILLLYNEELFSQNKIDFDDMIIYATNLVKERNISGIKYIIIDEYQDISLIRFKLINEIKKKTHAKIMCVGDDYQSIYAFSGSNLSLFVNFFNYFPYGKRIDIRYTYRNSYQLVNVAVNFIKKNSFQLRKTIYATHFFKYPVVLVYYDEDNYLETYNRLLDYLYLENEKNLLVLGRYNKNIEEVRKDNSVLNIKYLTIHMSKGLEEDNVILLRMDDSYLGFPSKIKNNRLVSLINNTNENILYPEERRLFYVALTRCRRRIYILVSRNNPSIFIQEIKNRAVELLLK